MDVKILEDIGLTEREIRVYLVLLEEGPSSAGTILEKASIQNSVFHFCVNRLIEKGLVGYIKKGKVRIYNAAEPENFLVYLEEKKNAVKKFLPELKARQNKSQEKKSVEIYEGTRGIWNALLELISDSKPGDEFLFFTADIGDYEKDLNVQKFYERYQLQRAEKKLNVKGIAPNRLKEMHKEWTGKWIRYTDLPMPANHGVCNDKAVFISWDEKPSAILIQQKNFVEKQRKFFYAMWDRL
ncbi:MAG: TrmB family transcriptional regulator [Candidatus Woesearchaeota archaeon]